MGGRRRRNSRRSVTPPSRDLTNVWIACVLALTVFVAYGPALRAPFVLDDATSITENASITRLWPPSAALHPPAGGRAVSGRPVVNFSLALDYWANQAAGVEQGVGASEGRQTAAYRISNVLIHLACGFLLAAIIARTIRTPERHWNSAVDTRVPLAVAAIWLLHPIQSEAVNYVVQRTELLVSAFCLLTLYSSIRAWDAARPAARNAWIALAAIACLLGMGSKEVMVVAPLIVILYDRAFRARSWRELVQTKSRLVLYSLLAATLAWLVVLNISGPRADSVGFGLGMSWYSYLYSQAWAVGHYLRLVLWPHPLIIDYGQNPVSGLRPIPGMLMLLSLAAVTCWAWLRVERWGWLAFLGTTFFLLLAPSSSVIPIRTEIAAERRIYLAFGAVAVVLVLGVSSVVRKIAAVTEPKLRWITALQRHGGTATATLCLILAAMTFQRSRAYAEPEKLWRPVVSAVPGNARGFTGLGMAIAADSQRLGEAERLFHLAIERDSGLGAAWLDLAYVEEKAGKPAAAEATLKHAATLSDNRSRSMATQRYGRVLLERGAAVEAIPYLEQTANEIGSAENLYGLGVAYLRARRASDAANAFYRVLVLAPDQTEVMRQLGRALIESGKPADAIDYLKAAVVREPTSLTLALLSAADAAAGHAEEAADAATASARVGDDADAHLIAGKAMMQIHRNAEAQSQLARAVQLRPDDCEALTNLGLADATVGDLAAALRVLQHAVEANSSCDAARDAIRQLRSREPGIIHTSSLGTKRANRIDASRAPSRDVTRDEDHDH